MIDPDDDEIGEGTGSPCDRAINLFLGIGWVLLTILISYLLTR